MTGRIVQLGDWRVAIYAETDADLQRLRDYVRRLGWKSWGREYTAPEWKI